MIALHLLRHAHAGDADALDGRRRRPAAVRQGPPPGRAARPAAGRHGRGARPVHHVAQGPRRSRRPRSSPRRWRSEVVVDRRLAGPLDPELVTDILLAAGPAERPCIVGHDPEFSELLGELVGMAAVPMRKGALARVDFDGPACARPRDPPLPHPAGAAAGALRLASARPGSSRRVHRQRIVVGQRGAGLHDLGRQVRPVRRPALGLHADRVLGHRVDDPPRAGGRDLQPQPAGPLDHRVPADPGERVVPGARRRRHPLARRHALRVPDQHLVRGERQGQRARRPPPGPAGTTDASRSPRASARRPRGSSPPRARPRRARTAGRRGRGTATARRGRSRSSPVPTTRHGRS